MEKRSKNHTLFTITLKLSRAECDIIVVATGPVASVGVNNWNQFCMMAINASKPNCVAHVTSQRTISRRRQFKHVNVIRITCNPNSNATPGTEQMEDEINNWFYI